MQAKMFGSQVAESAVCAGLHPPVLHVPGFQLSCLLMEENVTKLCAQYFFLSFVWFGIVFTFDLNILLCLLHTNFIRAQVTSSYNFASV